MNEDKAEHDRSKKQEYLAKLILIGVFFSGFALFIGYMSIYGPGLKAISILSPLQLVMLGLAVYRLGRLVSYDRVFEPIRQYFTETLPDPTGEGENVEPIGVGFQQSIGQMLCCPICVGTWIAALLVYLIYLFPGPMNVFLAMTAVIGAAEILNALTESLSWGGQYSRTMSGVQSIARKEREQLKREHQERQQKLEQGYLIDPEIDTYVMPEEWRQDR